MSFSSCDPDVFVYVKNDLDFVGNVPDPVESFHTIFDTLFDDETAKERKAQRQQARKEEEVKKKAEAEAKAKSAFERRKREEEAEQLALQYYLWQTRWQDDLDRKKFLTTFPHLPLSVCICKELSCLSEKDEPGSLRACQHDVERLLRASGMYEYAWLKKERLKWHPDRFGQRCDPDFRRELRKKAEKMYQIYEILMAQERPGSSLGEDTP